MLIFIPLMSVVYALFREVVYIKLRQKNIYPQDIFINGDNFCECDHFIVDEEDISFEKKRHRSFNLQ